MMNRWKKERISSLSRPLSLGLCTPGRFCWSHWFEMALIPDQSQTVCFVFGFWILMKDMICASFVSQVLSYARQCTSASSLYMALSCHHNTRSAHQVIRTPELPWHMVPHGLQPVFARWWVERTSLSPRFPIVLHINKGEWTAEAQQQWNVWTHKCDVFYSHGFCTFSLRRQMLDWAHLKLHSE